MLPPAAVFSCQQVGRGLVSILLISGLSLGLFAHPSKALDLGPMDGLPPPPGVTAISLEYQDQASSGEVETVTLGGVGAEIDRQATKLRIGHGFSLGSMPAYSYGELAVRDSEITSATADRLGFAGDSGMGDLAIATAIWPYVNPDAGRFWGVAGYVVAPVGDYDAEHNLEGVNLNPGSNRWIGVLQTGIHQRLGERWHWSLGADVTMFEDNDEVTRIAGGLSRQEVEPYITYQSSLAWQWHPALTLAASYYVDRGAESRLDDGDWQSSINRERYGLWALAALSRKTRVSVSYKSTVDNASDFELDDNFQIRIIRLF